MMRESRWINLHITWIHMILKLWLAQIYVRIVIAYFANLYIGIRFNAMVNFHIWSMTTDKVANFNKFWHSIWSIDFTSNHIYCNIIDHMHQILNRSKTRDNLLVSSDTSHMITDACLTPRPLATPFSLLPYSLISFHAKNALTAGIIDLLSISERRSMHFITIRLCLIQLDKNIEKLILES